MPPNITAEEPVAAFPVVMAALPVVMAPAFLETVFRNPVTIDRMPAMTPSAAAGDKKPPVLFCSVPVFI